MHLVNCNEKLTALRGIIFICDINFTSKSNVILYCDLLPYPNFKAKEVGRTLHLILLTDFMATNPYNWFFYVTSTNHI